MSKLRAVLKRRWPLLLVTTLVGVVAGVVTAQFATSDVEQIFTASQTIVANANSGSSPLIPQDELKVTRGEVPDRAAVLFNESGRGSAGASDLAGTIATSYDADSSSITIASNDVDPDLASARVQAFTAAFLEVTNAKLQADSRRQVDQLAAELQAAEQSLVDFDATYPQLSQPGAGLPNDVATQELIAQRRELQSRIADLQQQSRDRELELNRTAPYESLGPEEPKPATTGLVNVPTSAPVRAGLLGLLGLLLGGVVAMLIERVNRRVDTRDELAEITSLPILAEVGFLRENKRAHDADGSLALEGVWAEPYRRVRSAVQFVQAAEAQPRPGAEAAERVERPPQVFLVTSTAPGEGKSTTAALTGEALAEVGMPTLVIGGDFRRPEVDKLLGVPRSPSLQDMATMDVNRPTADDIVHQRRDSSLYVAPAGRGTREVAGVIEAAKEVAEIARERGATVVFDSSPLQAANDTIDFLPVVDYVILVVRSGRTTESGLLEVIDTLQRMDAKILGIVLIGTPTAGRQQAYYYDYYNPSAEPPSSPGPAATSDDDPPPPLSGGAPESATPDRITPAGLGAPHVNGSSVNGHHGPSNGTPFEHLPPPPAGVPPPPPSWTPPPPQPS